ncbi:hypothetical protein CDD80_6439 [Ophiocordyceps camponoti-rufipedis]|uniref:Bola-like protein n=1 Tax=Ophiocordyceps camponoti-rufipedis TaxID=2004952 RepID=A0A2C5ZHM3_9HYPO|nr:hypothetical protein CDD80_6439 [Ophiocordyceps camponoti-rufipedis]
MLRSLPLRPLYRCLPPVTSLAARRGNFFSSSAHNDGQMTPAELSIASLLTSKLSPTKLLVRDISGGCGTMYAIQITSPLFRGQSLLKQQRMVNGALGDLVKAWHGLQLRTSTPDEHESGDGA